MLSALLPLSFACDILVFYAGGCAAVWVLASRLIGPFTSRLIYQESLNVELIDLFVLPAFLQVFVTFMPVLLLSNVLKGNIAFLSIIPGALLASATVSSVVQKECYRTAPEKKKIPLFQTEDIVPKKAEVIVYTATPRPVFGAFSSPQLPRGEGVPFLRRMLSSSMAVIRLTFENFICTQQEHGQVILVLIPVIASLGAFLFSYPSFTVIGTLVSYGGASAALKVVLKQPSLRQISDQDRSIFEWHIQVAFLWIGIAVLLGVFVSRGLLEFFFFGRIAGIAQLGPYNLICLAVGSLMRVALDVIIYSKRFSRRRRSADPLLIKLLRSYLHNTFKINYKLWHQFIQLGGSIIWFLTIETLTAPICLYWRTSSVSTRKFLNEMPHNLLLRTLPKRWFFASLLFVSLAYLIHYDTIESVDKRKRLPSIGASPDSPQRSKHNNSGGLDIIFSLSPPGSPNDPSEYFRPRSRRLSHRLQTPTTIGEPETGLRRFSTRRAVLPGTFNPFTSDLGELSTKSIGIPSTTPQKKDMTHIRTRKRQQTIRFCDRIKDDSSSEDSSDDTTNNVLPISPPPLPTNDTATTPARSTCFPLEFNGVPVKERALLFEEAVSPSKGVSRIGK